MGTKLTLKLMNGFLKMKVISPGNGEIFLPGNALALTMVEVKKATRAMAVDQLFCVVSLQKNNSQVLIRWNIIVPSLPC